MNNYKKNAIALIYKQLNELRYIKCQRCDKTSRVECHHIIYRSEKPKHPEIHNIRNLILLCRDCHDWFHSNKANRNELVDKRGLTELFGNVYKG